MTLHNRQVPGPLIELRIGTILPNELQVCSSLVRCQRECVCLWYYSVGSGTFCTCFSWRMFQKFYHASKNQSPSYLIYANGNFLSSLRLVLWTWETPIFHGLWWRVRQRSNEREIECRNLPPKPGNVIEPQSYQRVLTWFRSQNKKAADQDSLFFWYEVLC